ncbi:hypothetical protein WICPIJ_006963 [Wickerhamomyces pijperi]|uniref:Rho-GAP domain-containing protein n=1 Tax=Wickerhamomyces pijperi TaxID=599730 RepID=A0A9P8Q2T1_WICPI|nr:hypothetical protein WICPIJ_006963 [Wickerhamomyces pijperi]
MTDQQNSSRVISDSSMLSEKALEASIPSDSTSSSQQQPATATATAGLAANSTVVETGNAEISNEEKSKIIPVSSPALLEDGKFCKLLTSDSAVETLLNRLKRSILTCEEFAKYIRKKAVLEQDHEEHLKKISRTTQDLLKTNINLKSDSFTLNFDKLVKLDDRIASQNSAYSKQLFQMHEELNVLASTITRNRKSHKDNFKRKEKEVIDSINAAEKAKQKYGTLCLELERVKTTDPGKKTLTLRGSKTTSEQEEILHRKIEAAETDYRQKVTASTGLRNVFLDTFRPNLVRQLKDIIIEVDIAMSVQLQKYSSKTEDLVLQTALSINPMRGANQQSMKVIASSIDNEKDLYQYVIKHSHENRNKALFPVEFRQHPSIVTSSLRTVSNSNFKSAMKPITNPVSVNANKTSASASAAAATPFNQPSTQSAGPQYSVLDPGSSNYNSNTLSPSVSSTTSNNRPSSMISGSADVSGGLKTFGSSIQQLNDLEGDLVPSFVRQCIYVVDKYGVNLEGIYRTSGNIATVNNLKDAIDRDPRNVKMLLPNPNSITDSDIYAVSSLLKSFFSQLPEALLTNEATPVFLAHGRIPEEDVRVKKLHELIFTLPDTSYWTLRSLILHLNRISSNNSINLMTARNLSIVWAPTLFPKVTSGGFNAEDMTCQGRVIEDLILRANDFFDPE